MEDKDVGPRPHVLVLPAARPHPPRPHVLVFQGVAPRPLKFFSFFSFFSVLGLFWRKWQETIFIFSPQFSFKINLFFSDRIPLRFITLQCAQNAYVTTLDRLVIDFLTVTFEKDSIKANVRYRPVLEMMAQHYRISAKDLLT